MSMLSLAVCLFGGFGSACRYVVDALIGHYRSNRVSPVDRRSATFPVPTLVINLVACALVGIVAALAAQDVLNPTWQLLLATGFLGGFSTLSTAVNEMLLFAAEHQWRMAVCYALVCLVVPLAAVALGFGATSWAAGLLA